MSTSPALNGALPLPLFWTPEDRERTRTAYLKAVDLAQYASKINDFSGIEHQQASAIAAYFDAAADVCLQESERIRERLPFVANIGGTVVKGTREEIDELLDGLDDLAPPT